MYFLLGACENPHVLRFLYFAILIRDLIFTIVPLVLVFMLIINFSKAAIAGSSDEKSVKQIPKKMISAIIIFLVPWIINAFMKILDAAGLKVAMDYNTCIDNAERSTGNFDYYDDLLEAEEEARRIMEENSSQGNDVVVDENTNLQTLVTEGNIPQGGQSWSTHKMCTGGSGKTIGGYGCGFCALTMVLNSFGNNFTPDAVVEDVCSFGGGGAIHAVPSDFQLYVSHRFPNNLKVSYEEPIYVGTKNLNDKLKQYKQYLKDGARLILNMPGHYIAILGIRSDDTLYVSDSSAGDWRGFNYKGPYKTIPKGNEYCKIINDKIIMNGNEIFDLSPYREISEKDLYTIETLFYTTACTYVQYRNNTYKDVPGWKNVTAIWKK